MAAIYIHIVMIIRFGAVANKVVDAAPVTRLVYDRAKQNQPELVEAVKIIAVSPPAGIGPRSSGKKCQSGTAGNPAKGPARHA